MTEKNKPKQRNTQDQSGGVTNSQARISSIRDINAFLAKKSMPFPPAFTGILRHLPI
jgi:hypothetical protein